MTARRSDEALSVWEHLSELRGYFFIALGALVLGAVVTHIYHVQIITLLFAPLGTQHLVFLSPLDPLLFIFRVDFFGGLLLALPVILFCVFRFIAPVLGSRSTFLAGSFFALSALLVLIASVYTYLLLLPLSIKFLLSIQVPGVENFFTADKYMDFALMQLALMAGIFQIPCVIAVLTLAGLIDPRLLTKNRAIAYIVAIIALSILTPTTDLYTLSLFLVPTLVIFEVSVLLAKGIYSIRTKNPRNV